MYSITQEISAQGQPDHIGTRITEILFVAFPPHEEVVIVIAGREIMLNGKCMCHESGLEAGVFFQSQATLVAVYFFLPEFLAVQDHQSLFDHLCSRSGAKETPEQTSQWF